MKFVVSRDPRLDSSLLWPFCSHNILPSPVRGRPATYHFWARNALFHGLKALGLKSEDAVLVPAFHCETVVETILHYGCRVVFYNVTREGIIDLEDLATRVDGQTKAIIAIHYFGILQPLKRLRAFCQQYQLFLIEDCAHILMGDVEGDQIGSVGDISIFSWRKFLPIYDGGLLIYNHVPPQSSLRWTNLKWWYQLKIVKNLLEKCFNERSGTQLLVFSQQGQQSIVQSSRREDVLSDAVSSQTRASEFQASQLNWPMSRWSQIILENVDLEEIVGRRKKNSTVLCQALEQLPEVYPWSSAGRHEACAWAFPVVTPTHQDIHRQLREKGIEAFSWGGVIHPSLPLEKFPDAKFLYEHLVLLP
ncbi:MAG: DegT/DnrJ/EryC1/StrS aminotransferase family protein, partial [Nitrospira sp.]|nr:DegT/DnrJ/EryC1/StrS aminotransferase family protein [Nitrospira sp.]